MAARRESAKNATATCSNHSDRTATVCGSAEAQTLLSGPWRDGSRWGCPLDAVWDDLLQSGATSLHGEVRAVRFRAAQHSRKTSHKNSKGHTEIFTGHTPPVPPPCPPLSTPSPLICVYCQHKASHSGPDDFSKGRQR